MELLNEIDNLKLLEKKLKKRAEDFLTNLKNL